LVLGEAIKDVMKSKTKFPTLKDAKNSILNMFEHDAIVVNLSEY